MLISHSEAETFSLCQRKHFYSYGLKIQKIGVELPLYLYRGIVGHIGWAEYYRGLQARDKDPLDRGCTAIENDIQDGFEDKEIKDDLCILLELYHKQHPEGWKIVRVESEDYYPLIDDELFTHIRPDLVAHLPGEGLSVIDLKFVYNFKPQVELELDPQLPKYYVGLKHFGLPIQSMFFQQVRYRELKTPTGEQIFRLSKLPQTHKRFEQTMREHAIKSGHIAGLRSLSIEDWEASIYRTANTLVCPKCTFAEICANDINGRDRSLMIKHYYGPRKPRQPVTEIEVDNI